MLRGNRLSYSSGGPPTSARSPSSTALSPSYASQPPPLPRPSTTYSVARVRSYSDPTSQSGAAGLLRRNRRPKVDDSSLPFGYQDLDAQLEDEVAVARIIEGRTNAPAALEDLLRFARRWVEERGGGEGRATLDVLDFLVAVNRYERSFRALPPAVQSRSPSPYSMVATLDAAARPQRSSLPPASPAFGPLPSPSSLYSLSLSLSNFPLPRPVDPFLDTEKPLPAIPESPTFVAHNPNPFRDPPAPRQSFKFFFSPSSLDSSSGELRPTKPPPPRYGSALQEALARRRFDAGLSGSVFSTSTGAYPSGIPTSVSENEERWSDPFEFATPRPPPPPPEKDAYDESTAPLRIVKRRLAVPQMRVPPPASMVSSAETVLPPSLDPAGQPLRPYLGEILKRFLSVASERSVVGLVPARMIFQAVLEGACSSDLCSRARYTTHPSLLTPLSTHLASSLSTTVLPPFLAHATALQARRTRLTRTLVALVAFTLTVGIVLLFSLAPFPSTTSTLPRVTRLATIPTLALAMAFAMAFATSAAFRVSLWRLWTTGSDGKDRISFFEGRKSMVETAGGWRRRVAFALGVLLATGALEAVVFVVPYLRLGTSRKAHIGT